MPFALVLFLFLIGDNKCVHQIEIPFRFDTELAWNLFAAKCKHIIEAGMEMFSQINIKLVRYISCHNY